ncbi:MAG: RNA-binding cell elongation regulator Jag/EloR [Acidimicrobiales bacterium]
MEWVETTGRSLEEAREAALDELGVDEDEAEFEVLSDARVGLFGRMRTEARVRARVRPTAPQAKDDRRERRRRHKPGEMEGSATVEPPMPDGTLERSGSQAPGSAAPDAGPAAPSGPAPLEHPVAPARPGRQRRRSRPASGPSNRHPEEAGQVEVPLDTQGQVAVDFLAGLLGELGMKGNVAASQPDEDTLAVDVDGGDLGVLIGPKGTTLLALQDLTRTVVQRQTGATNGRLLVDVSGYRHQRNQALARFAEQVAQSVLTSGSRKAMEPMSAADRKVVHDTVNGLTGVRTTSEGEDPHRYVVVLPGG